MHDQELKTRASAQGSPHQGQAVRWAGAPLARAKAAMLLVHGRGATAQGILDIGEALGFPDIAYAAPQAGGYSWYPYSFMAPMDYNEPGLTSGLQAIDDLRVQIEEAGIPTERIYLLGFSQGACLSLEYVARHAQRFGGVIGLSGGLIGPEGTPRDYAGSLVGTPVLLGCSDVDAHIPLSRVHETTAVLTAMGAEVDERIYPGMGHTINADEIKAVRAMLAKALYDAV